MKKNNKAFAVRASKHNLKNNKRIKQKLAKEDAHMEFLWSRIEKGMQLDFNKKFSLRVLHKLVSRQELEKHNEKKQVQ